jgi:hypothetical protein
MGRSDEHQAACRRAAQYVLHQIVCPFALAGERA